MSNFIGAIEFAKMGWEGKKKGRRESASGPGSKLVSTKNTRDFLLGVIQEHNINSMIDLGCGDFHWMKEIRDRFSHVDYEGWDAHEEMLAELTTKYGNAKTRFLYKDIVDNSYPHSVDLALCRDVLFHLKIENSLKVLYNIREAGIKYLLTTTYPEVEENVDIVEHGIRPEWGFYPLNLDIEPFNLKGYLMESREESLPATYKTYKTIKPGKKRHLALYKFD